MEDNKILGRIYTPVSTRFWLPDSLMCLVLKQIYWGDFIFSGHTMMPSDKVKRAAKPHGPYGIHDLMTSLPVCRGDVTNKQKTV